MPEDEVKNGKDLIHALHILDARIQLRVDKKDAGEHISMSLDVELAVLVGHFDVSGFELHLETLGITVGLWHVSDVKRLGKEAEVASGAPDIFLDLFHQVFVFEEAVPLLSELWVDGLYF